MHARGGLCRRRAREPPNGGAARHLGERVLVLLGAAARLGALELRRELGGVEHVVDARRRVAGGAAFVFGGRHQR